MNNEKFDDALMLAKQAEALVCGQESDQCITTLGVIGVAQARKGNQLLAIPYFEKSYNYLLRNLGQYQWKTLKHCANLGSLLVETGKVESAVQLVTPCAKELNDVDVMDQIGPYLVLSQALQGQKRYEDAEKTDRDLMRRLERRSLQETEEYADALTSLAFNLYFQKRIKGHEGAIEVSYGALAIREHLSGKESEKYAKTEGDLTELLLEVGDDPEGEKHLRHALTVMERLNGAQHPRTAHIAFTLANFLMKAERYSEAEEIYKEVHAAFIFANGRDDPNLVNVHGMIVRCLEAQGKEKEARKFERDNKMWVIC